MKPKAPRWLTKSFADGIDEQHPRWEGGAPALMHPKEACQLAQHDPLQRPCSGRLERAHYVNRQRIEAAMWEQLREARVDDIGGWVMYFRDELWDLLLIAAWDPRVGGIACSEHHSRLDSHLVPLRAERLVIPYDALPSHVIEWAEDYGMESQLEARCPRQEAVS